MLKKIIFNVVLNLLIICAVVIGVYSYKQGNYFIPIVCVAAFGLSFFYKLKLMKEVRAEMKAKAAADLATKKDKK